MGAFHALDIAASGANLGKTWLDAIAHNVANVNTVRPPDEEPFRAKLVVARARQGVDPVGDGVEVEAITEAEGEPPMVYDPTHPYADEDGMVRRPQVDLAGQMADMIAAQRHYQANLSVIRSSRDAYQAALRIGRN